MFNSNIIDVALAIVFIYFLFSIIASSISEMISQIRNSRGNFLREALEKMLCDNLNKDYSAMLYEHPAIATLKIKASKFPAYISSDQFALSLIDVIANESVTVTFSQNPTDFRIKVKEEPARNANGTIINERYERFVYVVENKMQYSSFKTMLRFFIANAKNEEGLRKNIEDWYNQYMERLGGWYGKKIRFRLFFIGIFISVILNVDSVFIIQKIHKDTVLRSTLTQAATAYAKDHKAAPTEDSSMKGNLEQIKKTYQEIGLLDLPIGYKKTIKSNGFYDWSSQFLHWLFDRSVIDLLLKFIGLVITAFAVSFGAPFWFNVINKLINVRSSIKPKEADAKTNDK